MMENNKIETIGFTVDAGLIQRLGQELVGRAETAVSELIKNAYDADATIVNVEFIDSYEIGGTLIISDDGVGMTLQQLQNGFMRISSSDKVHNPSSIRYQRTRAGKKGIGRFAAQRLGEKLTIITQTRENDFALELNIDWHKYEIDKDISSIQFPIRYIEKQKEEGTILKIYSLKEKWSDAAIQRVYRYVMDLFQPAYLSERSKIDHLAIKNESTFKVAIYRVADNTKKIIVDEQISVFDKSLAVFEGHITEHKGHVSVTSNGLGLNDIINVGEFSALKDVHFKIHYFIYNRPQYYGACISMMELNKIQEWSKIASGVRLYRNGFRVLPYGEPTNDWTNIDRRWSSESGQVNVPMSNKNLFGFVEIIDPSGTIFEETASREGLIENEAFKQLSEFINKSLVAARNRIAEKVTLWKSKKTSDNFAHDTSSSRQSEEDMFERLRFILNAAHEDKKQAENNKDDANKNQQEGLILIEKLKYLLEEAGMLRVLAGLGLTIGEFTHEIKQFQPSVYGHIHKLLENLSDVNNLTEVKGLNSDFDGIFSYTRYFSTTISQNTSREKQPVDVLSVLDTFKTTVWNDLCQNKIDFEIDPYNYNVETIPMHKSEWTSIIYNLYTNARKAIKRANVKGRILVEVGIIDADVVIRFNDNGDGIPEENKNRIFNAFFSTSVPASFDAPNDEQLVGTGLGLKIVKDIVDSYKGDICVIEPKDGYSTCIQIRIPQNNN